MKSPSDILCEEWVAILREWVEVGSATLAGDLRADSAWILNREAFGTIRPSLQAADQEALRAVLSDFGAGILHSVLVSLEQGPISVEGPAMQIVEAESGKPLSPGLNELFMSAALDAGLIK